MQCRVAACDPTGHGSAADEVLCKALPGLPDGYFQFFREGIDNGRTNAVQPTSSLIDALGKFATRMRHSKNDSGGRQVSSLVKHGIKGHAARFVAYSDPAIAVNADPDLLAEARYRLIDGIIERLPQQRSEERRVGKE